MDNINFLNFHNHTAGYDSNFKKLPYTRKKTLNTTALALIIEVSAVLIASFFV